MGHGSSLVVTGTVKDCWELTCGFINLKVGKGESWGLGSFLREMGTVFTLLGCTGFFLPFYMCVCLLSPLWQEGREEVM